VSRLSALPRDRRNVVLLFLVVLALALTLVSGASPARSDHYDRHWTAQGSFMCDNPAFHDPKTGAHNPVPIVGARVEFYQAANTTIDNLYTGFRDDLQQVGVDVPGHDPLDHLIASTHTDANGSWSFNLHAVGDTGDPPFYARLVLDDDQGVRLFDGWAKFFDSWSMETARAGNNGKVVDYGTYEIARNGGSETPKCAVWQGAHNAYQDYVAETGQTPPSQVHWISYGWPTSTPFTTLGQTNWPDGSPTTHPDETDASGNYIDGGYAIDFHEFGHDVRHSLDGDVDEFLKDVARFDYPQNHQECKLPAGIDNTGKLGFAFNEGWAEFWARTPQTCDDPPHDYRYEGNVAAALTALTVGSPGCPAVSRAALVRVLAANPGRIHSWDEFLAAFRTRHQCGLLSLQGRKLRRPIDWGGESIPLNARTLRGRTQIELSQARLAVNRLTQLIRRNPVVGRAAGCPPNCAVALGKAVEPSLLSAMRAQLQLAQHEIQLQRAGTTGDALWRQLTTAHGIAQADSEAHSYARASTALTTSTIAQALKTAASLGRKRNAQLSKEIGNIQSALRAAKAVQRPGHLASWIEGIDSDLNRRIGPARLVVPTQLALSCAPAATTGSAATASGRLTPAIANQPIAIQVSGGPGSGSQKVTTAANGSFTASFTPGAAGKYTIAATYAGDATHGPSAATCAIPVTNPSQSSLSLNCPATASPGQGLTVTAQLSPPLQGASIDMSATGPSTVPSQTVQTDATGLAYYNFTIGTAGAWTITAKWAGDATHAASTATCAITVNALGQSSLSLNCPATASPGQGLTVTAQLSPPLQGASIDMSATGPSTVPSQTVQTDATGLAYYNFTIGTAGAWTIKAKWAGDAKHQPSSATCPISVTNPTTITLTCPPNPLTPSTTASVNGTLAPAINASPVSITYTPPPTSGQTPTTDSVTTDNTGYFADSFGQNASGTWTVTATFAGDITRAPSTATCTFTVLSP
jgi:hypothetical protein